MKNESDQLDALQDIRKMMKESSRFLSLSGLSGILAGLYALGGAWVALVLTRQAGPGEALATRLILVCLVVLGTSLVTAFVLSGRKARKNGHRLFDHASRKLMWTMGIPLLAGGLFCISLLVNGGDQLLLIVPAMLIFYGLALIAGSRLTLDDVRYLGYLQLVVGLIASFYKGHDIFFWALGFGVLHIIYGSIMWYKYDRNN